MVLVHCQSRRMSYHHYEQSVKDVQVVPTTKGVTTLGMRFSRQRIALLLQETRNNTNGIRLALTLLKARGHDVAVQVRCLSMILYSFCCSLTMPRAATTDDDDDGEYTNLYLRIVLFPFTYSISSLYYTLIAISSVANRALWTSVLPQLS